MRPDSAAIRQQVKAALDEDIGGGDVSAALIDPSSQARATLITRQTGILAGRDWADTAFWLCSDRVRCNWQAADGDRLKPGQILAEIQGPAHALLSAERTALNFVQLLSGIATRTAIYVAAVAGTGARILDTRKTLPGLRLAQKYAVTIGGGHNHRLGLFDMIMLKENHIAAAGGIRSAVERARKQFPELPVEVEVEALGQLSEALQAGADRIMLDNFSNADLVKGVRFCRQRAVLEASGGITLETLRSVAETGVDDISVGELTKSIEPLDLSLRFITRRHRHHR